MKRGVYVGKEFPILRGKTALIKPDRNGVLSYCEAQFDDTSLPVSWTHGWVSFLRNDFRIVDEGVEVAVDKPVAKPATKVKKEWEPDTVAPELMKRRLREW